MKRPLIEKSPRKSFTRKDAILKNRKGHCYMYLKRSRDFYWIVIGPDWYMSLFGILMISILGSLIYLPIATQLNLYGKISYLSLFGLTIFFYIACFLINPGASPKREKLLYFEDIEKAPFGFCKQCNKERKKDMVHCEECDICIEEHDHHCIWMGKCVGKGNKTFFYLFLFGLLFFFIFMIGIGLVSAIDAN